MPLFVQPETHVIARFVQTVPGAEPVELMIGQAMLSMIAQVRRRAEEAWPDHGASDRVDS
jgi:hypothetical protein